MTMKYPALFLSLTALAASVSSLSAQAAPTITVEAAMAPNAYGSPSFATWAANGIYAAENGLTTSGAAGPGQFVDLATNGISAPMPESYNWVTGFSSWLGQAPATVFGSDYADELGTRASFMAVITAAPGTTISIDQMGFTMTSSDPGDWLGWSWGAGTWNYDSDDIGLIFDHPAEGIDGGFTVVDSGDSDQQVNEIISIGAGDAYASYDTVATGDDDPNAGDTDQQIINYDIAELGFSGYDFTGTFTYGEGDPDSGSTTFDFNGSVPDGASTLVLLGLAFSGLALMRRKLS
jgi:hypothetical protein